MSKFLIFSCMILALTLGVHAQVGHGGHGSNKIINLEVLPSQASIMAGDSLEFTVIAQTSQGTVFTPNSIQWMATGGVINSQTGVFRAGNTAGDYFTVTAMSGHKTATARVSVKSISPSVVRILINPTEANLYVGQTMQFTATAYDMYNRPVSFTPYWRTNGGGIIDSNGLFRATGMGQFVVSVRAEGINMSATANVSVGQYSTISRIVISPANYQLYPGQAIQFTAVAYDNYGRTVSCNPIWGATGGNINQRTGYYQAHYTPGYFQIWAKDSSSGVQGTGTVTVIGNHPTPPIPPVPPSDYRIVITNVDIGGNFLTPKVKMDIEVFGYNIQTIRLYAINHNGRLSQLDSASCKNGSKVYLKSEFNRFETKSFELQLFDTMGNIVARDRRDPVGK